MNDPLAAVVASTFGLGLFWLWIRITSRSVR